ncbi:Zn-ribbon domain-containing OB-fold protein [Mycolicibacterium iranicum]|uniref:DNA-binding protein n=1 Tax=Mycolicibacterium iranicum TaxID=912594 RepID=A0A178LS67_MYCIR|nr:OB-fold domain-containing protein [Mycolicibacterium iranicum]OAN36827.1 DNA-binding protein [Mycolicibacterium iranicum]
MGAADRPTTDTDSDSWWSAIQEHVLQVNSCNRCGRKSLYARPFCPHCWSEDVTPTAATGRATLYTWTLVHQNAAPFDVRTPYTVAMVDLEEGPRLMTTIEHCSVEQLHAGMPLVVAFRTDDDGFVVPTFRPQES